MAAEPNEHYWRALSLAQQSIAFHVLNLGYVDQRAAWFVALGTNWAHGKAANGPIYLGKRDSTAGVMGSATDQGEKR